MVVLFDFDEVFVDLNSGAINYINEKKGTNYTLKDITSWDFFDKPDVREPFFEYLALPNVYQDHVIPNKKMIKVLKQMVEMGKEVYIVTASVESSQESKYKFIKEHMSFFDTDKLFTVNNSSKYKKKSDVLDELTLNYHEPIVLVDDGIHNILDMMADIKHKEKLDGLMKQFYMKRTLQGYNNPYHEFIYGIVPELPYNKDIIDGKRIFKIKETKNIWEIFKNIESQHKVRVETKQAEVFNYLGNIVTEIMPVSDFKNCNEIQNNVSYFTKAVLGRQNKHANFLSEVAQFNVAVEAIQNGSGVTSLNTVNANGVNKIVIDSIFKSADKKFGSDVMYQEIKNLVILHSASDAFPDNAKLGKKISESYNIHAKQDDFFSISLIKTMIDISKDNMLAGKMIIKTIDELGGKEKVERLLHKAGMAYEIDFEDKPSLVANAILAFNKNYSFDPANNSLVVKDSEIDAIRTTLLYKPVVKATKPKL